MVLGYGQPRLQLLGFRGLTFCGLRSEKKHSGYFVGNITMRREKDVDSIVAAWRRVLGIELNPEIVLKQLATIRRWQRQGGGSGTADTYQGQTL